MSNGVAIFPPGSKLFVVSNRYRVGEKRKFFIDPARALLWAITTEEAVRPVPLTAEENMAQVLATSLHEKLVRKARFPLNSEYVLAEFVNPQQVSYINSYVTEEQFAEVEKLGVPAIGVQRIVEPSFIKSGFISVASSGEINIDQTYENLAKVKSGPSSPMESAVVRILGPVPFVHNLNYSIDWEQLWYLFIEALIRHGSGGMAAIKNELSNLLSSDHTMRLVITGQAPPGYDDCYDALIGPFNQALNSCFMDSTLICLFGFKNSPFYQHLVLEEAKTDTKFTVCSKDRGRDRELRLQIQALLREDVAILIAGRKRFHCTNLRRVLGNLCSMEGDLEDLSQGTHDPAELYTRLIDVIGYSPMVIRTVVYRARDEEGTDEIVTNESVTEAATLPSLRAGDETIFAAAWPFSWQTEYEELPTSERRNEALSARPFLKTVRQILRADAVIVHIDRSVAAGEEIYRSSPPPIASFNPLLTLFGSGDVFIPPEEESFGFSEGPRNPAVRNEMEVNPRPVSVQLEMDVNGVLYVLKAFVFSPTDGHYAALLHCGDQWFKYDDLEAYEPISRRPMSEDEALTLLQTRGTLLFYYPTFMGRLAPLAGNAKVQMARPGPVATVQMPNQTPMQNLTLGSKK